MTPPAVPNAQASTSPAEILGSEHALESQKSVSRFESRTSWDLYSQRQRWSYVGVLFAVITSNYFDYYVLSVVLESIKREFSVSDTLLGILSGSCFSLAFAITAFPIARWADRGNRRTVIVAALAGWSVMTTLCGFAHTFVQLAVARFFVGMMEPGAIPPAESLVADYFPPEKRATAIAVLLNGASAVGWLVGVGVGSHVATAYGWRAAFLLAGIPGLALALVARFFLPEPRCRPGYLGAHARTESFRQTALKLWRKRSITLSLLGVSVYSMFSYGITVFIPSFIVRSYHTPFEQVSTLWGTAISASNIIGAVAGGWIAERLGERDVRWYTWLPGIACLVGLPLYWLAISAADVQHFIALEFLAELALSVGTPIITVAILAVCGGHRRAIASAAVLCSTMLIGVTLGPVSTGVISDALNSGYHGESLRYSMAVMCIFLIPAALCFLAASRTMLSDKED